eukprot:364516-Chlamydomonas_euryale.AAC.13
MCELVGRRAVVGCVGVGYHEPTARCQVRLARTDTEVPHGGRTQRGAHAAPGALMVDGCGRARHTPAPNCGCSSRAPEVAAGDLSNVLRSTAHANPLPPTVHAGHSIRLTGQQWAP